MSAPSDWDAVTNRIRIAIRKYVDSDGYDIERSVYALCEAYDVLLRRIQFLESLALQQHMGILELTDALKGLAEREPVAREAYLRAKHQGLLEDII